MQSALIVHSRHTKSYAKLISERYKDAAFLEVKGMPTAKVSQIKNLKDVVIGIGGGSVIDTAKIIAKNKRCIAIPTTAAGAAMTPYATVWGREKKSVSTMVPVLEMPHNISLKIPFNIRQSTLFDALSHAVESYWSINANKESKKYSKKAICLISKLLRKIKNLNKKEIYRLITAGNYAGKAIAITKTNVVHAASYPITIKYGVDHGTACGMLLPYFVKYMKFKRLPELFGLNSTEELFKLLKKSFVPPELSNFDARLVVSKIMRYDKINNGPKKIDQEILFEILKNIERYSENRL